MSRALRRALLGWCGLGLLPLEAGAALLTGTWDFQVLLDGKPIGEHRFQVEGGNGELTVRSNARFDVKLLFIPAYRYRHSATERWRGDCLVQMDARTDDNGTLHQVQMSDGPQGPTVTADGKTEKLGACPMSFAYWTPKILQQQRLLNAQTGEYQAVQIRSLGESTITVRGVPVRAAHWRIEGPEQPLDLWYSPSGEWLQLESSVSDGKRLRYQLKPR